MGYEYYEGAIRALIKSRDGYEEEIESMLLNAKDALCNCAADYAAPHHTDCPYQKLLVELGEA